LLDSLLQEIHVSKITRTAELLDLTLILCYIWEEDEEVSK